MSFKRGIFLWTLMVWATFVNAQDFDGYATAVWVQSNPPNANASQTHLNNWDNFLNTSSRNWGGHSPDANAIFGFTPWTDRSFQNENFGSHDYNGGSLLLRGFEVKTEKWSGGNVCDVKAFWRINGGGAGPLSSFQEETVNFFENCPSSGPVFPSAGPCNNSNWQKWQTAASGGMGNLTTFVTQDLTTLSEGNYSLEVYYEVRGHNAGGNCSSYSSRFVSNGGSNYRSDFSICPALNGTSFVDPTEPMFTNGEISMTVEGYNPDQAGTFEYRKGTGPWQSVGGTGATRTVTGLDAGDYEMRYTSVGSGCSVLLPSFTLTNGTVVPVELLNFDAVAELNFNKLKWQTASELNNSHFEVERSTDGLTFERIAQIDGHGTTQQLQSYTFRDKNAPFSTVYYRLRQVDFDGTESLSRTVVVYRDASPQPNKIIYPNPAEDELFIQRTQQSAVTVFNALGKHVKTEMVEIGPNQWKVNVSDWPAGLYWVVIGTYSQPVFVR